MQYVHEYLQGQLLLSRVKDNKQLRSFEYDLIGKKRNYPDKVVNKLHQQFYQLDIDNLETLQIKRQHDPIFHRYMQYFAHALISTSDILPDFRLRRLYTSIHAMNDRLTMHVVKFQEHPLFAMKVNINNNDHIPHEALIGFEVSNNLRMLVPNFVQTYEVYHCRFPLTNDNSAVWSISDRGPGAILLLEYVYDAVSLKDLAKDLTKDEFLQIYVQVINALNVAYKRYRFTHYDLHSGNILVQRLITPMSIPIYDRKGVPAYLLTTLLVRIIDMEYSHAIIAGYNFGASGLQKYNVFPDRSFPMHDAYKLLLFTYEASLARPNSSNNLTSTAQTIYDFFDEKKTVNQRLLERDSNLTTDFYQPDKRHISRTHDELLQYLCSSFNLTFLTGPTGYSYTTMSFTDYLLVGESYSNLVDYYLSDAACPFNKEKAYRRESRRMCKFLSCTIRDIKQYEQEKSVDSLESSDEHRKFILSTLQLGEQVIKCKLWLLAVYHAFHRYPQEVFEQAMVIDEYYTTIMNDLELEL